MATVRLYLDCRAVPKGKPAPLKLAVSHGGSTCYVKLDVKLLPTEWDAKTERVLGRADKAAINTHALMMKARAMGILSKTDTTGMTPTQVKDRVKKGLMI